MVFKFRNDYGKAFNYDAERCYFNKTVWEKIKTKYNAKIIGDAEIEITIDSLEEFIQFFRDADLSDIAYYGNNKFVHRKPHNDGTWNW